MHTQLLQTYVNDEEVNITLNRKELAYIAEACGIHAFAIQSELDKELDPDNVKNKAEIFLGLADLRNSGDPKTNMEEAVKLTESFIKGNRLPRLNTLQAIIKLAQENVKK